MQNITRDNHKELGSILDRIEKKEADHGAHIANFRYHQAAMKNNIKRREMGVEGAQERVVHHQTEMEVAKATADYAYECVVVDKMLYKELAQKLGIDFAAPDAADNSAASKKALEILAAQTKFADEQKKRFNEEPNAYELAEQAMNGPLL